MTRAPTYPIHRNRRNSISIRFSVRSIRFSRCGPGPVGPRPPASLALGGKEIHYPPRGAESRGSSRSTGPPQPGGGRRAKGNGRGRTGRPGRAAPRQGGRRTKHSNARRESWGRAGDLARFYLGARLNQNDSFTKRKARRRILMLRPSEFFFLDRPCLSQGILYRLSPASQGTIPHQVTALPFCYLLLDF